MCFIVFKPFALLDLFERAYEIVTIFLSCFQRVLKYQRTDSPDNYFNLRRDLVLFTKPPLRAMPCVVQS
jgi:hypothetical protein